MFFKPVVNKLVDVELQDNLRAELEYIEQAEEQFMLRLKPERYEQWRRLAVSAHRAIAEVKKTRELAQDENTEQMWRRAYRDAKEADAGISVLRRRKAKYFFYTRKGYMLFMGLVTPFAMLQVFICAQQFYLRLALMHALMALVYVGLEAFQEALEAIEVDTFWCDLILAEACEAGVVIDPEMSQALVNQAEPWSNAVLLDDMGCDAVPDEFNCNISFDIMTNPVYCVQHSNRYDRDAMDQWLCEQNTHPVTRETLDWDDLISDRKLKKEIHDFVHDQTKQYIDKTSMRRLLECVEMKAEDKCVPETSAAISCRF